MHDLLDVNTSNLIYQDISKDGIKLIFRSIVNAKKNVKVITLRRMVIKKTVGDMSDYLCIILGPNMKLCFIYQ